MTMVEIRPRFREEVTLTVQDIIDRMQQALDDSSHGIEGVIIDHHIVLKFPVADQHYWSPQLSLSLEEQEGGALVRGLFGPRPTVWLMFVFLYSVIGAICLFVAITGFSQLSLGIPAPVLWVLPIGAILASILYFSAKAGERLGKDEMIRLKNFLNQVLVVESSVS
jgi:hypothetical protein